MDAADDAPEGAGGLAAPLGDGAPQAKKKQKSKQRRLLELSTKTAMFVIGLRVGMSVLRRMGRLLSGPKADVPRRPSKHQEASAATALPTVPPAAHWAPLDIDAPSVPPDFKVLVTATVPCSVYTLYCNVFSQQSTWLQQQHEQIDKQYNYVKTAWQPAPSNAADYPVPDDQNMLQGLKRSVFDFALGAGGDMGGSFVRTVSFVTPPKPPNSADTRCVQRQQFCVTRGGMLVLATAMNMLDIPFKECFMVNTAWRVEPAAERLGACTVTIWGKVHFLKGTLVSGIIRATTFRDLNSFYKKVMENLQALASSAAPVPEPLSRAGPLGAWGGARSLVGRQMSATVRPAAARHQALPSPDKLQMLAESMPLGRQLRIFLVVLVLFASVAHQLLLHREVLALRREVGLPELYMLPAWLHASVAGPRLRGMRINGEGLGGLQQEHYGSA